MKKLKAAAVTGALMLGAATGAFADSAKSSNGLCMKDGTSANAMTALETLDTLTQVLDQNPSDEAIDATINGLGVRPCVLKR